MFELFVYRGTPSSTPNLVPAVCWSAGQALDPNRFSHAQLNWGEAAPWQGSSPVTQHGQIRIFRTGQQPLHGKNSSFHYTVALGISWAARYVIKLVRALELFRRVLRAVVTSYSFRDSMAQEYQLEHLDDFC